MLTVTAAIITHGSKVLIAKRSYQKHFGGLWEFPGGKINKGETPQICLKRELKEELDIIVKVGSFYIDSLYQDKNNQILLQAFLCEHISGKILVKEHEQVKWVELNELHKYQFAPPDIPIVKSLINAK